MADRIEHFTTEPKLKTFRRNCWALIPGMTMLYAHSIQIKEGGIHHHFVIIQPGDWFGLQWPNFQIWIYWASNVTGTIASFCTFWFIVILGYYDWSQRAFFCSSLSIKEIRKWEIEQWSASTCPFILMVWFDVIYTIHLTVAIVCGQDLLPQSGVHQIRSMPLQFWTQLTQLTRTVATTPI